MSNLSFINQRLKPFLYIDNDGKLQSANAFHDYILEVENTFTQIPSLDPEPSLLFIEGYSKGEFKNKTITTPHITLNNIPDGYVTLVPKQDMALKQPESAVERLSLEILATLPVQDFKLLESRISRKFIHPNTISIAQLSIINDQGSLEPLVIYVVVEEMTKDYDKNCETCKMYQQTLVEAIAQLSGCIFYNRAESVTKPEFTSQEHGYQILINPDNCPKYQLNQTPTLITISETIKKNFLSLLWMSKIAKLSFHDSYGRSYTTETPYQTDEVLF